MTLKDSKENEFVSLTMVKEMMKVQQETMMACFNQVVENLSKKVDGVMCDVQDIKSSLNFSSNDYDQKFIKITNDINKLNDEFKKTNLFLCEDNSMLKIQKEKVTDLEDRSRRNNLRIDGIQESEREKIGILQRKKC